jgi:hypothetical protein
MRRTAHSSILLRSELVEVALPLGSAGRVIALTVGAVAVGHWRLLLHEDAGAFTGDAGSADASGSDEGPVVVDTENPVVPTGALGGCRVAPLTAESDAALAGFEVEAEFGESVLGFLGPRVEGGLNGGHGIVTP